MKRTILLLVITVFLFSALVADDFILKSGQIVFGKLVGIKDSYMYVLDDGDQLAIISFDQISEIETDGGRSVFGVWSMRKPFMKIDPLVYKDRTAYFDDKKDEDSNSNIQTEISDPASSIQYHEEQTDYNVSRDKTTSQSSMQNKPTTPETPFYDSVEVGINPFSKHPVIFDNWAYKWGKTEKPINIFRLKPLINFGKDRIALEDDDYIASTEMLLFGLEMGVEHHRYFADRYSPYIGFLLHGRYHNGQYEYTDENGDTYEITGIWLNNGSGVGYWQAGVAFVSGFDLYLNKKIYLGMEVGYGITYVSNLKIVSKSISGSTSYESVISDE
ncbi:MAG: hypothetical protein GX294_06020, partial [Candidatus Cloacimonetes bacterium]|nr:hypothetical protein [Candidatus Cloacimonadota bacterium]